MDVSEAQLHSEVNPEEQQRVHDARATLATAYRRYVGAAAHLIAHRIGTGAIADRRALDSAIQDIVADGPYAGDAIARFDAIAYGDRDAAARPTGFPMLEDGGLDWKAVASFAVDSDIVAAVTELVGPRQMARLTQPPRRVRIGP